MEDIGTVVINNCQWLLLLYYLISWVTVKVILAVADLPGSNICEIIYISKDALIDE